jgi:hypothetical protein
MPSDAERNVERLYRCQRCGRIAVGSLFLFADAETILEFSGSPEDLATHEVDTLDELNVGRGTCRECATPEEWETFRKMGEE